MDATLRPSRVIRQPKLDGASESTPESRAVMQACLMDDIPCSTVPFEELSNAAAALRSGDTLPVGSVEYVRAAMSVAGFAEPENMSYPLVLDSYLYREVRKRAAGLVLGHWFVKPVLTKTFTGFVFDTMQDPASLSEHDLEQYNGFMAMKPDAEVWISERVSWLSEVRYYVLNGLIVGEARYDPDGAEGAPLPQRCVVDAMVDALAAERGAGLTCVLDVGVLSTGETALVEANDGWSIGSYGRALSPATYLELLATRWKQISDQSPSDQGRERLV